MQPKRKRPRCWLRLRIVLCSSLVCRARTLLFSCKHEIPHSAKVHVLQCNYRNAHLCHVSSDSNYYSFWCVLFFSSYFESPQRDEESQRFREEVSFFPSESGSTSIRFLAKIWNASAKFWLTIHYTVLSKSIKCSVIAKNKNYDLRWSTFLRNAFFSSFRWKKSEIFNFICQYLSQLISIQCARKRA